eukprot:3667744-Prymnesium_polylepis.1
MPRSAIPHPRYQKPTSCFHVAGLACEIGGGWSTHSSRLGGRGWLAAFGQIRREGGKGGQGFSNMDCFTPPPMSHSAPPRTTSRPVSLA